MFVAQVLRHYLIKCSIFKTEKTFSLKNERGHLLCPEHEMKEKIQDPLMKMIPKTPRFLSLMPHS